MTNINRYNTYIQSIFHLLSVNNKPQLIGTAKLKNHRHRTDFDSQEFAYYKNSEGFIGALLQSIFSYSEKLKATFLLLILERPQLGGKKNKFKLEVKLYREN